MDAKNLEKIGTAMFPTRNWKARVAEVLNVKAQTVYRWANGDYDMPGKYHNALIERAEEQLKNLKGALYAARGFKND